MAPCPTPKCINNPHQLSNLRNIMMMAMILESHVALEEEDLNPQIIPKLARSKLLLYRPVRLFIKC